MPCYIDLPSDQFYRLFRERPSPPLSVVPPRLYCQLDRMSHEGGVVSEFRKRVGSTAMALQNRRGARRVFH